MDELRLLLKTIRAVGSKNPVTYIQLSEIIRRLWRPRAKVYSVYQAAHGFTVGDVIKPKNPLWVKAKADTEANAKATAIVCDIVDEDNFIFLQEGIISGDYIIGKTYFLSITTAGAVFVQSDPEVWSIGNYRQMIGTGTADGLLVEIDEGMLITPKTSGTTTITNVYPETIIVHEGGTEYPLSQTANATTVRVFLNGIRQHPDDYNVIENTVVFDEPTFTGDKIRVFYEVWNADVSTSETPVGEIDGANKEFTLEHVPDLSSLEVYLNGVLQNSDQITVSGKVITFIVAPYVNDTILIDYKTASASGRAYNISPAGDFDGLNTEFTLPSDPTSGTLKVYLNGVRQAPGVQYTLAGAVISFTVAPYAGDWILCDFES